MCESDWRGHEMIGGHMRLMPLLALFVAGDVAADDLPARARTLHAQAIIVDTHIDTPDQLATKWADVATRGATDHFDLVRAKEGGLSAAFFSIYIPPGSGTKRAHELIDITLRVVDGHRQQMTLAASVAEIRAAKQASKLAVLMGLEGGHGIEDSLAVLRSLYRTGVRYMTLTHVNTNHWADSAGPMRGPRPKNLRVHRGLNDFGREVVKEMNRLGMIVDISHVSDETIDDVLGVTRAPVMASHSSCRALANVPRNLSDDHLKRIGASGGMVMISFGSAFLVGPKAKRAQWTKIIDHIDHAIAIAGEDAVGLGSDFDGVVDPPIGLEDVSMLPKLTEELLRRGHSEARIKKILGENFLAFFARVEAARDKLAKEPPSTATLRP
jgi:membrane dipeptidase